LIKAADLRAAFINKNLSGLLDNAQISKKIVIAGSLQNSVAGHMDFAGHKITKIIYEGVQHGKYNR